MADWWTGCGGPDAAPKRTVCPFSNPARIHRLGLGAGDGGSAPTSSSPRSRSTSRNSSSAIAAGSPTALAWPSAGGSGGRSRTFPHVPDATSLGDLRRPLACPGDGPLERSLRPRKGGLTVMARSVCGAQGVRVRIQRSQAAEARGPSCPCRLQMMCSWRQLIAPVLIARPAHWVCPRAIAGLLCLSPAPA